MIDSRTKIQKVASWLQLLFAVVGMAVVLAIFGWPLEDKAEGVLLKSIRVLSFLFGCATIVEFAFAENLWRFFRKHWPAAVVGVCVLANAFGEIALSSFLSDRVGGLAVREWLIAVVAVQQIVALVSRLGELVPWIEDNLFAKINPGLFLAGSFAFMSFLGSLLLMMPNATYEGIHFLDALFTSTSAVCVTGLIVVDTASYFTPFGQVVILGLIQMGGFGIMTITFFIALISRQGLSVTSGVFLRDMLSTETLGRLGSALSFIFVVTFVFEGLGAVAIYHSWKDAGLEGDLGWLAVFHSISAYCNAGFSVLPDGLADVDIAHNRWGQVSIMALIILGGIGFPVIRELWGRSVGRFIPLFKSERVLDRSISLHTKTVLCTTFLLLVGGMALFVVGHHYTSEGEWEEALWLGAFRSVTARTAGFNISDLGLMSQGAAAVMMVLMLVGGSPGGMAGGIKTTTFAIAVLNLWRTLFRKKEVTLFNRRIEDSLAQRSFSVVLISLSWIAVATIAILLIQPELHFLDTLFETVSAYATVGVSRGITSELEPINRVIIIATMFVGRIGLLNFCLSLIPAAETSPIRYPSGNVFTE